MTGHPFAHDPSRLRAEAARLRDAGRSVEALNAMRRAAALSPDDPAVLHDLGLDSLTLGAAADAAQAFRRMVALKPDATMGFFHLAMALERLGQVGEAAAAYGRALELKPRFVEAHYQLGLLLDHSGARADAAERLRKAAALAPQTRIGRLAQAQACLCVRDHVGAERMLKQTLAAHPGDEVALDLLGTLMADAGRFDEAREAFEQLLAVAPHRAGAWYDIVRCRRIQPADAPMLERMDAALSRPDLSPTERNRLYLAAGKALDDLGDPQGAMAAFDAADRERRRENSFDLKAFNGLVDGLIARFQPGLFQSPVAGASGDPTPMLILGMPRSGTTLAEQILSCHPDVAAGGELPFWTRAASLGDLTGGEMLMSDRLQAIAGDYLRELRAISPDAARVTDKMPFNFLWVGLIRLAFPNAVIVHCRRSPIDTALSVHMTHFGPGFYFPTGGPELVGYIRAYQRIMDHWRRVIPSEGFVEVDYEALTAEPEVHIRRLVDACGLPWDEACLHPERNARRVATASKWQARQPIYRSAVERWRKYEPWLGALQVLAQDEIRSFRGKLAWEGDLDAMRTDDD